LEQKFLRAVKKAWRRGATFEYSVFFSQRVEDITYVNVGIYERTVDSLANNAFDLGSSCNPPGVASNVLAYVGVVRDTEHGVKYKEPHRGDINVAKRSWRIPKSLNASLQDPTTNYDVTDMLPLGSIMLHEQVHAVPDTGEKQSEMSPSRHKRLMMI
jgi:hypothetical protein